MRGKYRVAAGQHSEFYGKFVQPKLVGYLAD
jgi:hypothetical protein